MTTNRKTITDLENACFVKMKQPNKHSDLVGFQGSTHFPYRVLKNSKLFISLTSCSLSLVTKLLCKEKKSYSIASALSIALFVRQINLNFTREQKSPEMVVKAA